MDMQFSFRLDKVVVDFYWSCAWISFSRSNISNFDFISIICEILSGCVLMELRLFPSWLLSLSSSWLMVNAPIVHSQCTRVGRFSFFIKFSLLIKKKKMVNGLYNWLLWCCDEDGDGYLFVLMLIFQSKWTLFNFPIFVILSVFMDFWVYLVFCM